MQTPHPIRSGHIYMKDAQQVKSNEKSIFFLSYGHLYFDAPGFRSVVNQEKNLSKVTKFTGKMHKELK